MTEIGFSDPRPLMRRVAARILPPPQPLVPSEWMGEHLVVPDGPRAGGRWDPRLTPYVAEIVDTLGPNSPYTMAAVEKSQQTGLSVAGIGLAAAYIDRAPARIGYALPTIDMLHEFNREKLTPTIEQTPALAARIRAQKSRDATGSTMVSKRFPGGSMVLLNANSAPDLRSKTLKIGIADEVDQWQDDLEGQGDPFEMFLGRFTAFHATEDWRVLALSTPTLHNASRISALFQAGDQRYWHVKCPQCETEIVLEFANLRYAKKPPHKAEYIAQCCGFPIEHHQKAKVVREGRYIAKNPGGLYPSFHVDALISQVTTWDKMAEAFLGAEGNERKLKAFYNLWLGLPYEVRGDAPDHVRLMERRESYPEKKIPPLGLLLTCGADVQHSGIWVHIDAWAPDGQSWVIWREFLEGDTTDPNLGAFLKLQSLYDERFEDAFGNRRLLDAMAIDAGDGGRANQVYAFARGRSRAYAIKGMPGWSRPALGTPTKVSITLRGKKLKGGVSLWPVGTWDLKAEFYSDLRKEGRRAGQEVDPPGYVHFGEFLDEPYFRQITSETLVDSKVRGRVVKIWKELGPNHLLDARVYSRALAEHLGLTRKTKDDWLQLAKRYSLPTEVGDLFASAAIAVERAAKVEPPKGVAEDFARSIAGKQSAPAARKSRFARLGKGVRKI